MARPLLPLIDRYVLRVTVRPLATALIVVMLALLLERLLRLFRLVAGGGGPFDLVAWMALNLVPHYLGLAIPAALFVAIHAVVSRLDGDSELDAMRSAGISTRRVSRAFFVLAVLLSATTLTVVGWLQPWGRYQYRALAHAVAQGVWDGRLPARALVGAADGLLLSAERVTGRQLEGVYVRQQRGEGGVQVTTARHGQLVLTGDGKHMHVRLEDGVQIVRMPNGATRTFAFTALTDIVTVRVQPTPFRARGEDERELTLPELVQDGPLPLQGRQAELHARLVRAAALPLLPMLGMGLGLKAKRARRKWRLAVGVVLLFVFHHAVLTGESLARAGQVPAMPALWGPFILFALVSLTVYAGLDGSGKIHIPQWSRR